MFRRRRGRPEDADQPVDADESFDTEDTDDDTADADETVDTDQTVGTAQASAAAEAAGAAGGEPASRPAGRPSGPWDVDDAPQDDVARLDLVGLRVPVFEGMEVRVEIDQQQQVVAATLVDTDGAMQVSAFAAPRSAGIWAEVSEEIVGSLRDGGGSGEVVEGPFGREIQARVPTQVEGQGVVLAPARFLGVDGPRWFVRGLMSGPAAEDPVKAARLEEAFRGVVVVRGGDPMAPRDPLPLALPKEALEAVAGAPEGGQPPAHDPDALNPFERGPEITETR